LQRKGDNLKKGTLSNNTTGFIHKKLLINLKTKAQRSGTWYRLLRRIDRVLFNLTIRVLDSIRSKKLAKSILEITTKLENGLKSNFSKRLVEIGLPLAQKIGATAHKIGNPSASEWSLDKSFSRFLAVMFVNAKHD
jgi:hypothetical protein